MEAVGPVFGIVKCLWGPLVRQIGYVKNLKRNFEKLEQEAKELYAKRDDMNSEVIIASPGKVRTNQFQDWIKRVVEIEQQISDIAADFNEENKCFKGWCPNICLRRKLGKNILNLIDEISELKKFDSAVVADAPPMRVETVYGPKIENGTSVGGTLQRVVGFIRDASIQKIGIWGMGGVGKTTLMKNLNNLPEIAQIFYIVIWVTVSKDWTLRKVQNEVAQRLSLNLSNDMSDDRVSSILRRKLENTKYLLLLDDVWETVNLEDVGIPIPNAVNGCKIVLTTRSRRVCLRMETNEEIKVEVLCEEEAWGLFCEKVGSVIDTPEIHRLATSVVKECGGLPLAIVVLGGALGKEDDVHVWKNALRELRSAAPSEIEEMEEEVFKPLKFSYDRLTSVRKNCFLYSALYPEDHKILPDELIEYWRAAGFLDGGVGSLAEAFDRGRTILKALVDASLLEKCQLKDWRGERVKIHDVIRDLALRITSVEGGGTNKFLVRAGMGTENPPRDEEWVECKAVSLMDNRLVRLPEQPSMCPNLSTLLLQDNPALHVIPESFFNSMTALQVLDLSRTSIEFLPPSICNLVSLRGIYLNKCRVLVKLPSEVGALKELEVLDLGGTDGIEDLPIEVGNLKKLIHLKCRFRKLENLESFISTSEPWKRETLSYFHFTVRYDTPSSFTSFRPLPLGRYLRFEKGDNVPQVIKQVLHRAEWFNLSENRAIANLGEFGVESMTHLKRLIVQYCGEMKESLIDRNCSLPNLEELHIWYMPNLRNIWEEEHCGRTLVNLRWLDLQNCPALQNALLPQSMIQQLPNLEEIRVYKCEGIKEIIGGDFIEYNALPKLKLLELTGIYNLASICKQVLAWPSIEEIHIEGCENLRRLSLGIHNTSTLKKIQCNKEWWESLQWEEDEIKPRLQPFLMFN